MKTKKLQIIESMIKTDETLTKSGIPADSAATGKALDGKVSAPRSVTGEVITVSDSGNTPLYGLTLYGKTTQNGTPTPENPVELVSVGADGSVGVTVCGKNLYNVSNAIPNANANCEILGNTIRVYSISSEGTFHGTSKRDIILLKGGVTYTLSGEVTNYVSGTGRICFRASTGWTIKASTKAITANGKYSVSYTPEDDIEVFISLFVTYNTTGMMGDITFSNVQLEIGSTATDYESYKEIQTLTASTPNGLPGIPVSSGGNYTDENGQMWICDEIDFTRGKYVQNIQKLVFDGSEPWRAYSTNGYYYDFATTESVDSAVYENREQRIMCSNFAVQPKYVNIADRTHGMIIIYTSSGKCRLAVHLDSTDMATYAAEQYATGNPVTVLYQRTNPIETDLSAEELAAYAALHTNKPNTTVYNDAGAYMEVSYFTPNAAVPMNIGSGASGKVLGVDEHGYVTPVEDVVYAEEDSSDVASIPLNADTLGGIPADDYATESFVTNKIAEAQLGGGSEEIDLSGYATKDELNLINNKIPTTAEQVGARPNTWLPSLSDINAAPAGFGLGNKAKQLTNADNLDTIWESGWYYWDASAPANAPIIKWDANFSKMRVDGMDATTFTQTVWSKYNSGDSRGIEVRRTFTNGVTDGWEWVNPPMTLGVEYRTTERIDGKAVYKKNVNSVVQYRLDGETDYKNQNGLMGAAPAGYGLGTTAKRLTSADDLNTTWQSGWYDWGGSAPANAPQISAYGAGYGCMQVDGANSSNFIQTVWSGYSNVLGAQLRRRIVEGVDQGWEWVTPRMETGVEYRTTERYNGKVVYTKLINTGTLTNGGYVTYGTYGTVSPVRCVAKSGTYLSPYYSANGIGSQYSFWHELIDNKFTAYMGSGHSAGQSFDVQIWYTK